MAIFSSGSYITSTPLHQQHDSGFYENSPQSRNVSQISAVENLESNFFPLRKNLFGKRRSSSENIPDHKLVHKHKLLLSRSSTFLHRDASSNKETPRTSRNCVCSDKPVHFAEAKTHWQIPQSFLNVNTPPLKQLDDNDSGFFGETPEISRSPKSESYGIPFLQLIENSHQRNENPKEESLVYFKHSLNVSRAKNYADLSTTEILQLYNIYRFQKMGIKPSAEDIDVGKNHLLINEMNILSWKDKLEWISATLDQPDQQPKIDFLSQLHKMHSLNIVLNIFSYLSARDLQNVSCVSLLWRKLVLQDENANAARLGYLKEILFRKERQKEKSANPFQRPPKYRILKESNENVQMGQLQLKKTIEEINFDAFIEVGKSGDKHKPMKCPSCGYLSLQDKKVITKCRCSFCSYEFCCDCLKPYSNWHLCASTYLPVTKPPANSKRYLQRL